ncbi:PaaI family thioesterase [Hydrogenophaga sp.]|uniref:PaaI family thioesterase n=1 Tax=Hydrogenophaga sp. TaxID=1904254 RepID=UPI00271B365C|nr:PaaI family thioesterase [Hydrogenophaga sp.]MDO9434670.1 PaaI family thioesterase [Hydrogenophaga sp.]
MSAGTATPLRDFIGLRFVAVERDGIRMRLDMGAQHLNQGGTLHGGVLTSMIDIACAVAVRAHANGAAPGPQEPPPDATQPIITLTLNTAFLGATASGPVTVVARQRGGGKRIRFVAAEVFDAHDKLIATGDGSYTLRSRAP